jgi:hypothetical protein
MRALSAAERVVAAPASLHEDVLGAVDLDPACPAEGARKRDPQFPQRVLTAYEWRCAVCGFDVRQPEWLRADGTWEVCQDFKRQWPEAREVSEEELRQAIQGRRWPR